MEQPITPADPLKPCPFCGSEKVMIDDTSDSTVWAEGAYAESREGAAAAWDRRATPAAAAEMPQPANERTATDYALEFAEYLAKDAEGLLEAMDAEDALRLRREESDDVSDDDMHDAGADRVEHIRAVRNGIYEFRKRRDRAAKSLAAEIVPLTDERQAFEAWRENYGWVPTSIEAGAAWIAWQARAALATQAAPASKDLGVSPSGPGSSLQPPSSASAAIPDASAPDPEMLSELRRLYPNWRMLIDGFTVNSAWNNEWDAQVRQSMIDFGLKWLGGQAKDAA